MPFVNDPQEPRCLAKESKTMYERVQSVYVIEEEETGETPAPVPLEVDSTPQPKSLWTSCVDTVSENMCVPLNGGVAVCTGALRACCFAILAPLYQTDSVPAYLHRLAGAAHAAAFSMLLQCWMRNRMDMFDTLAAMSSTAALVLLNTVSSEHLNSATSSVRQQVRFLVTVCYLFVFAQWARSVWPSGDAGNSHCEVRCCRWSELFYGMSVFIAVTLMFFGSMVSGAWNQAPNQHIVFGSTTAASMSVVAVAMLVTGGTLLIVAVSHNPVALLSPFPYLVGGAALALVSVPTPSPVLLIWQRFIPAWVYCSSISWPIVLHTTGHLNASTMWFALFGNVGVVGGCRLLMVPEDRDSTRTTSQYMY
jgi:hypothetical protein